MRKMCFLVISKKVLWKEIQLNCFVLPLFHKHSFSLDLTSVIHLLKTSCFEKITLCNWDNARVVDTCPDQ